MEDYSRLRQALLLSSFNYFHIRARFIWDSGINSKLDAGTSTSIYYSVQMRNINFQNSHD